MDLEPPKEENGGMQIGIETVWQVSDGSYSGNKKSMKQLRKLYKKYIFITELLLKA